MRASGRSLTLPLRLTRPLRRSDANDGAIAFARRQPHNLAMFAKPHHEAILKSNPHLADFLPFLDILRAESARGATLVAASYIENLLHHILKAHFIEGKPSDQLLTGFNAPLGSLSAKIAAATALGLINERESRECSLIRRIRNKFAHEVSPTFEDPGISDLCIELSYRAMPYDDVTVSAEGSFTSAAVSFILNLTNRAIYVSRERGSERQWPG